MECTSRATPRRLRFREGLRPDDSTAVRLIHRPEHGLPSSPIAARMPAVLEQILYTFLVVAGSLPALFVVEWGRGEPRTVRSLVVSTAVTGGVADLPE